MPLDPQSQAVLEALNQAGIWDFGTDTPVAIRARMAAGPGLPPGPEVQVRQGRVAGAEAELDARFYRPVGAEGLLPTLIYVHGGGFVLGDLDGHDNVCRQLCADAGCGVISLDYRLAPDAKFPAAPEDCYAATRFIHQHAKELGVDAARLAERSRHEGPAQPGVIPVYRTKYLFCEIRPSAERAGQRSGCGGRTALTLARTAPIASRWNASRANGAWCPSRCRRRRGGRQVRRER